MHTNELREQVAGDISRIDELSEKEDRTEDETTELTAAETRRDEGLVALGKAVKREDAKRALAAVPENVGIKPEPEARIEVVKEEHTYRNRGEHSYFKDLINASRMGDAEARDRLHRNTLEARDLSRTDTSSVGEFVPPLWLVDLYQPGIRASRRVTANLCTSLELPGKTDSINIPRISTNLTVAEQASDNAAVSETDAVSATVTAPVRTMAGQNDVAIQVLEQSALSSGFDQLIFSELQADLDRRTDVQVIAGAGTSGTITGILATTGIKTTAYTDASPTVPELFPAFGQVSSVVTTARLDNVEAFVMHPRRWFWLTSQVDSANRAYLVPTASGPYNAYGTQSQGGAAEGQVGQILGIPVFVDPNIPILQTNGAGAAGTEDTILVGKFSDALLFEGPLHTRVLPDVLSGTLTVRLQLYRYMAFTAARAGGVSFGKIYDTGLAAPSGY